MSYPLHAIARAGFDDAAKTDTMDWTATYNTCLAACNTLNARNDGETYQVAFVIDENDGSGAYAGDFIYATNGESANNWRIDALWKSGTYTPLVATHSNAALGINDRNSNLVATHAQNFLAGVREHLCDDFNILVSECVISCFLAHNSSPFLSFNFC